MEKDKELMNQEGYKSVSIAIPISMHRRIRARASGDGRTISGFIRTIFNREFCEEKDERE